MMKIPQMFVDTFTAIFNIIIFRVIAKLQNNAL